MASAQLVAHAQEAYPTRPVRIIVAYAAGGGDDAIARVFAERLTQEFGRQFIVDNRPSAGGIIGFETLSKAPPDGYMIGVAGANITVLPSVRKSLPFDAPGGFTPISQLTVTQLVLVVHPSVPARTVKELIALGKRKPGQLAYASSGIGATPHLSAELFRSMTGLEMVHVPYRSGVIAMTDLAAGRVDLYFGLIGGITTSLIEAGRVRAIAVTGTARHSHFPQVPTLAEAGLPGYEMTTWYSMIGPAGMAAGPVTALNAALRKAVASPEVSKTLRARGMEPKSSLPEELRDLMQSSQRRFAEIARKAGIQPE
ncbi:MAG: tripartite tricarboxylate transporter substrate binding protein [Burkholderiales bacterium]|nr:tripartite tricarboxylate transporter substrate binding protein [Burkholderiales bacterium]